MTDTPATPADAPSRKKAPRYDVFERRELHEPQSSQIKGDATTEPPIVAGALVDAWVPIAEGLEATSEKAAIAKATSGVFGEDSPRRFGTFAVALAGEFRIRTRAVEKTEREVWS